jgi:DNA polymerase III epsilon subunit-like protein
MNDKKGKYVVIDTEATGLVVGVNGICEIAAAVLDAKLEILETISFDVNPDQKEINPESLKINGFTRERVEAGISYKESCVKLYDFIYKYFDETPTFIAQFYPFDYSFLTDMYTVSGMHEEGQFIFKNKFLDTKSIANFINLRAELSGQPLPFPNGTSLSSPGGLKDVFKISDHQSHTALGDVMATRRVLLHLLSMQNFEI